MSSENSDGGTLGGSDSLHGAEESYQCVRLECYCVFCLQSVYGALEFWQYPDDCERWEPWEEDIICCKMTEAPFFIKPTLIHVISCQRSDRPQQELPRVAVQPGGEHNPMARHR